MSDKTFRRPIDWHCGSRTDRGCVRELNEDALIARPDIHLWAVADGMGGHQVGDVASRIIIETLAESGGSNRLSVFVDEVENKLREANQRILHYASTMFEGGATMGSTLVSLLICGRVGVTMWVGDSRLYRLRNQQLKQITSDHSHVQELLRMGAITEEEAEGHPQSNVITRAIGVDEEGLVDLAVFNVQVGDIFLLCSDGLHNSVDQRHIRQLLSEFDAQQAADSLIAASLENGAPDNVSVIVIKGEPGKFESKAQNDYSGEHQLT